MSAVLESRLWPLIHFLRRDKEGLLRVYLHMPGNFYKKMDRPLVDRIENLPPAIAIEQRNRIRNARSTVGTVTEIHDYLRLLFAKIGKVYCPDCKILVQPDTVDRVLQTLLQDHEGERIVVYEPTPTSKKEEKKYIQAPLSTRRFSENVDSKRQEPLGDGKFRR